MGPSVNQKLSLKDDLGCKIIFFWQASNRNCDVFSKKHDLSTTIIKSDVGEKPFTYSVGSQAFSFRKHPTNIPIKKASSKKRTCFLNS